nr:hypothetical protein 10 [Coxiellaceae bacterium]
MVDKNKNALPADYYQRDPANRGYDQALFLAGKGLQSAELNDIQAMSLARIQGIGDALFQEGDIVSGAHADVNPDTGETVIDSGRLYLQGGVRQVAGAQLTIPCDKTVHLGIRSIDRFVTEKDDPDLRDPAIGTRNYQEAGAARLQRSFHWEYQIETPAQDNPDTMTDDAEVREDQKAGAFYPIYPVINGILIQQSPPPQSDALTQGLARYDHEAHGHYVVNGLTVQMVSVTADANASAKQHIIIDQGKAHINGFAVELTHPLSLTFPVDADLAEVTAEPHPFIPDSQRGHPDAGAMTITLAHTPVAVIHQVGMTRQKTVTMTHGAYAGAFDALPDNAVLTVVSITQGSTRYVANKDYRFEAGQLDWSLSGKEPAAGSRYTVVCQVRENVIPERVTETGCVIRDAVRGSLVLVDYAWILPRTDIMTLMQDGTVQRLRGISQIEAPLPVVPADQLALASIKQTGWRDVLPTVNQIAVHRIPMRRLQQLQTSVQQLYQWVAQLALTSAASQASPAVKKGLLVDPFIDELVRDAGLPQTAAIVDQALTLPILEKSVMVDTLDDSVQQPLLLPFELIPSQEQPLQTVGMTVNFSRIIEPAAALMTLTPPVDRWTVLPDSRWTSALTRRFSPATSEFLPASDDELTDTLPPTRTRVMPLTLTLSGCYPDETITISVNGQMVALEPLVHSAAAVVPAIKQEKGRMS